MGALIRSLVGGVVVGLASVLVAATAGAGGAAALPVYPVADPDPFFSAPPDLAAHAPGEVLKLRQMPPNLYFPGSQVWEVLFSTKDSQGHPMAANTTFLLPPNRVPDGPLVSYQHIINALGTRCERRDRALHDRPVHPDPGGAGLNIALARGWTVTLPDHLGPSMAYGAAKLGGQITLDGLKAVRRIPEFRLANSPVALAGYSGGGMATAWAAAMAPTYAPELNIVGAPRAASR